MLMNEGFFFTNPIVAIKIAAKDIKMSKIPNGNPLKSEIDCIICSIEEE